MNTRNLGSKKWRVVITVIIVTLVAGGIENGSRVLRFTNFKTSNGPDVHIYMVAAEDAMDSASVEHADFIDLGLIKGNIGDQNYTLGSDLDLAKYRTVSVWCKRFSKNFGAAPLVPDSTTSER